jgi:hypothetical protein
MSLRPSDADGATRIRGSIPTPLSDTVRVIVSALRCIRSSILPSDLPLKAYLIALVTASLMIRAMGMACDVCVLSADGPVRFWLLPVLPVERCSDDQQEDAAREGFVSEVHRLAEVQLLDLVLLVEEADVLVLNFDFFLLLPRLILNLQLIDLSAFCFGIERIADLMKFLQILDSRFKVALRAVQLEFEIINLFHQEGNAHPPVYELKPFDVQCSGRKLSISWMQYIPASLYFFICI